MAQCCMKLYRLGIKGTLWRTLVYSYRNIQGCVLIIVSKSKVFKIRQGTRQGVISTSQYSCVTFLICSRPWVLVLE